MNGFMVKKSKTIYSLGRDRLIRAYKDKRNLNMGADDSIYGRHTERAYFKFIKKYMELGYSVRFVDYWHDEHEIVQAEYNGEIVRSKEEK